MISMRWEAQWTLLLFGCATILYGIVQVNTRSPSTLLQSAPDSVPADTRYTRPNLGATFQVRLCSREPPGLAGMSAPVEQNAIVAV